MSKPKTLRATETIAVRDPDVPGAMSVIEKDKAYQSDHPLVKAYAWAFAADDVEDAADEPAVETATAEPGSKRTVKR